MPRIRLCGATRDGLSDFRDEIGDVIQRTSA
jgi:hypothetical protein